MATFTELYTTLLGFVNFRLYHSLNLVYPPKVFWTGDDFKTYVWAPLWTYSVFTQLDIKAESELKGENEDEYAMDSESYPEVSFYLFVSHSEQPKMPVFIYGLLF